MMYELNESDFFNRCVLSRNIWFSKYCSYNSKALACFKKILERVDLSFSKVCFSSCLKYIVGVYLYFN